MFAIEWVSNKIDKNEWTLPEITWQYEAINVKIRVNECSSYQISSVDYHQLTQPISRMLQLINRQNEKRISKLNHAKEWYHLKFQTKGRETATLKNNQSE